MQIVNIVICYYNEDEIVNYISELGKQKMLYHFCLCIVVNGSNYSKDKLIKSLSSENFEIQIYFPNENLGYLNGLSFGYKQYKKSKRELPDYIIFSNTDISFIDDSFFDQLQNKKYEKDIWLIGPNILSNNDSMRLNPFILQRQSKFALTKLTITFRLYNILEPLVRYLEYKKSKKLDDISSTYTYAVHGSFMILKSDLADIVENIKWQLLYGEEHCLSEVCLQHNKKVFYDSGITIRHVSGTVTGREKKKSITQMKIGAIKRVIKEFY